MKQKRQKGDRQGMVEAREAFSVLLVVTCMGLLLGCATQQPIVEVEGGLSPEKLSYYNDPFDELRKDLWDPLGLVYTYEQGQNYRSADIRIEDNQLVVETQVGSFSKGGLGSKFSLRGDFDIQIDCSMDFVGGDGGMDQVIGFAVIEKGTVPQMNQLTAINLIKKNGEESGIFSSYRLGKWDIKGRSWLPMGDFRGSFRIVRVRKQISLYYRKGTAGWRRRNTFPTEGGDAQIGILLQNFVMTRTKIVATKPVIAKFDNFRINGAHEIIEPEI